MFRRPSGRGGRQPQFVRPRGYPNQGRELPYRTSYRQTYQADEYADEDTYNQMYDDDGYYQHRQYGRGAEYEPEDDEQYEEYEEDEQPDPTYDDEEEVSQFP
jgi:hypothetical protein